MTTPPPLQQVERTFVQFKGEKLSYFSGCDYFRMASEPRVVAAAKNALKLVGLNVSASRMTTGNHHVYEELEAALANFFDVPEATLVSTGYLAPQAVTQALAGEFSHAFIDEHSHPCLFDAAHFLRCPVICFRHRDSNDLSLAWANSGKPSQPLVLTDGMFSRDGSVAPLRDYLRVLPSGRLLVDDSHGAGVLGPSGKGTLEEQKVNPSRILRTLTLSKAFGAFGGVVLGNSKLRKTIVSRSRCFSGSTPIPLPLAAAALAALRILKSDGSKLDRLRANQRKVRSALPMLQDTPGPIIALPTRSPPWTRRFERELLSAGIYPPLLRYHTGRPSFRFVLSSEHTTVQIDALIRCLRRHF